MPNFESIAPDTRVSSAAIKSTSESTFFALSERSERLPIGVPTRYSVPFITAFFSCVSGLFIISIEISVCVYIVHFIRISALRHITLRRIDDKRTREENAFLAAFYSFAQNKARNVLFRRINNCYALRLDAVFAH